MLVVSTGRSIRAWGTLCGRQMTCNAGEVTQCIRTGFGWFGRRPTPPDPLAPKLGTASGSLRSPWTALCPGGYGRADPETPASGPLQASLDVAHETEANERGERTVWLEPVMVDWLGAMRGPDESFSDAIIRIAGQEALATRRG
jgi:hypothetical protein